MLSDRRLGTYHRVEEIWLREKWRRDSDKLFRKVSLMMIIMTMIMIMMCEYNSLCNKVLAIKLYLQDLLAHFGCVNAVEWSDDGCVMVSGGDDTRVLVWNTDQALTSGQYQPEKLSAEHESNIFCLSVDHEKRRVFSGGNDAVVIVHDLVTRKPLDVCRHDEPVYGLSVHPDNNNIFLSASSDGRVLLFDMRVRPEEDPLMIAGFSHAFHAAQFNPVEPRLIVSANQKHGIGLWDVRRPMRAVLEYGGLGGQQSSMYACWNSAGDKILGIRRRLSPVVYSVLSPAALAQFDHPGYYNSCTMKSCSFAGPDDEYVVSGSDDFNVYMWKVPDQSDSGQWIPRAHAVIRGHRSIVNQVENLHHRVDSFDSLIAGEV